MLNEKLLSILHIFFYEIVQLDMFFIRLKRWETSRVNFYALRSQPMF